MSKTANCKIRKVQPFKVAKFVYFCITCVNCRPNLVTKSTRNTNVYKFAKLAQLYFPYFTTFRALFLILTTFRKYPSLFEIENFKAQSSITLTFSLIEISEHFGIELRQNIAPKFWGYFEVMYYVVGKFYYSQNQDSLI